MSDGSKTHSGEIVDASVRYTLREVCEICGVHAEFVIELVDHGVIEPAGERTEHWTFSPDAVRRAQRAQRLLRDLDVNLPGASLSLDLLERIDELRDRVRRLERELRWLQP